MRGRLHFAFRHHVARKIRHAVMAPPVPDIPPHYGLIHTGDRDRPGGRDRHLGRLAAAMLSWLVSLHAPRVRLVTGSLRARATTSTTGSVARRDGVIPVTVKRVGRDPQSCEHLVGDLDGGLVATRVERRFHA